MQINLKKPELTQFVQDEVTAGRYPSPEAVVEAALDELRDTAGHLLDDDTVAAIQRAEEQLDRGEGIEFEQLVAEVRRRTMTP